MIVDLITKAVGGIFGLIDKSIPDQKLRSELQHKLLSMQSELISAQSNIIVSESENNRNWRPHLMYVFMAIIANNYILVPFIHLFFDAYPLLPLPPQMWTLLDIGIGGYVIGRSVEKASINFKKR